MLLRSFKKGRNGEISVQTRMTTHILTSTWTETKIELDAFHLFLWIICDSYHPRALITSPGHFSDRTFFVTPAFTRFSSLLSVINIDSLIVCLHVKLLSFILLLFSGKLPLRWRKNFGLYIKNSENLSTGKRL